jgi:non-hemolytic enterotoxin B/C
MLVDAYAQAVLKQGIITLAKVPSLADNQRTAQTHATSWLNVVSPQMIQTNTDLLDFAHNFNNFYTPLVNLASNINTGNNRALFIQGLQILITKIQGHQTNAQAALTAVEGFSGALDTDLGNFNNDLTTGTSIYEGDHGEVKELTKANDALQDAMNKDMAMIAGGAVMIVVGGLMVAVGALAEIETAGASTVLIVGGLAVAGGGGAMIGIGAKNYSDSLATYKANVQTIATDNAEMAALTVANHQITALTSAGATAQTALSAIVTTWQTLGTQYNAVIDEMQTGVNPDDGPFLLAELATAKNDWDDVAATAQLINQQCIDLPVVQGDPGLKS